MERHYCPCGFIVGTLEVTFFHKALHYDGSVESCSLQRRVSQEVVVTHWFLTESGATEHELVHKKMKLNIRPLDKSRPAKPLFW